MSAQIRAALEELGNGAIGGRWGGEEFMIMLRAAAASSPFSTRSASISQAQDIEHDNTKIPFSQTEPADNSGIL